jgi:CHAT domain-containing protein
MTAALRAALAVAAAVALACGESARTDGSGGAAKRPTALDSLIASGEALYARGEHDSAGTIFQAALDSARRHGRIQEEARLLTWLGLNDWRLDRYASARQRGEAGLALKLRHGLRSDLWRSYNALGLLAYTESRYLDAVERFERARERAELDADTVNLTKTRINLGISLVELGEYRAARALLDSALSGAVRTGESVSERRALINLGMLDVRTGHPAAAIPQLTKARERVVQAGDYLGELNVLGQLATAYEGLGEPGRAVAHLDTALQLSRDSARGSRLEEASSLAHLAQVYLAAGDPRRALQVLEESIAIDRQIGLPHELGAALRHVTSIQQSLGNSVLADSAAVEALTVHRSLGTPLEVLHDLLSLAELRHSIGRPVAARAHLAEARRLAEDLNAPSARIALAFTTARISDAEGRSGDVMRTFRGLGPNEPLIGLDREWEMHHLISRAHARAGRADSALGSARRSLAAAERIRGRYGSTMLRTSYLADRSVVYEATVDLLVAAGQLDEALELADAARGRALLEHLATLPGVGGGTTRELAEGERQLLEQIDSLAQRVNRSDGRAGRHGMGDPKETARLAELLEKTRAAYSESLVRAQESGLKGGAGTVHDSLGTIDIKRALLPHEVLVEFLVGDRSTRVFVVTKNRVASYQLLASRDEIATRARVAREITGRPDTDSALLRSVSSGLGELLLGPLLRAGEFDGKSTLIIVPHAELGYVPFAALRNPRTGRYVVEDYALLQLPTATALPLLRARVQASAERLTRSGFAPFPGVLPGSEQEVRAFSRVVADARAVTGRRATERMVRRALATDDLVHLATHGVMNARSPMFSRLELARGVNGSADDDGRLEVHEVLGLRLRASLVVLSGCETATGATATTAFYRGEDYGTLAQAFLFAGAFNVLATLWKVRDDGAAAFARSLYAELRLPVNAGAPPPEAEGSVVNALSRAQRVLIASDRYSAPFYWAGYVVSGSGDWGARRNGRASLAGSAGSRGRSVLNLDRATLVQDAESTSLTPWGGQ